MTNVTIKKPSVLKKAAAGIFAAVAATMAFGAFSPAMAFDIGKLKRPPTTHEVRHEQFIQKYHESTGFTGTRKKVSGPSIVQQGQWGTTIRKPTTPKANIETFKDRCEARRQAQKNRAMGLQK